VTVRGRKGDVSVGVALSVLGHVWCSQYRLHHTIANGALRHVHALPKDVSSPVVISKDLTFNSLAKQVHPVYPD
jgi:hypothetical protein